MKNEPRGISNNNPLNIRRSADRWRGLREEQTDAQFCQFKSLEWGLRAAFIILRTYMTKYKLCTVTQLIGRWAPRSENDTARYIDFVCKKSWLKPNERIKFSEKNKMCILVWAMANFECGQEISYGRVENGYAYVNYPR